MFDLQASIAQHFEVADTPFTNDEIRAAAKQLKWGKALGTNKFRHDTVKQWCDAEQGSEDAAKFDLIVKLCQEIFAMGHVPKVMKEGISVLIPKDSMNSFRGITLLDTVYKLIASVINAWATEAITFHKGIHGFRAARGCKTAIEDAKWDMMACQESGQMYHQVFLDLSKAFDTVDRMHLLSIMRAYGFGERTMNFFTNCWVGSFVAPHAGGMFGPRVNVKAGVRQGNVISPLLFNLIVEAIL